MSPRRREPWSRSLTAALLLALLLGAACDDARRRPLTSSPGAPILLYAGEGTSKNDVAALEALLSRNHLDYSTADAAELERLTPERLSHFRLLIIPGGDFVAMGQALGPAATSMVRAAVLGGLSYLGICAGAFLAGKAGDAGLDLVSGARFTFYAAEAQGLRKAAVPISTGNGPPLEHYWEDGPQLSGWGAVVGTYPDGTPAIVEGSSGKGWLILSGVHPEAPESWRRGLTFNTPVSADQAYAATLIDAALHRRRLRAD